MLLNDQSIKKLIEDGTLDVAGHQKPVGPLSYDLTTRAFYSSKGESQSYSLNPGESVFVGSDEIIKLPANLAGRVLLKNSRIREGLSMDAPLYFPGHKTRVFFRVTNVSANRISLDTSHDIASIAFEELTAPVERPYDGAFVDEFDFRNMASYEDVYGPEIEQLERKADDVLNIEKRLYGNVITLMAVFVGIFSLVDVNLVANYSNMPIAGTVSLNLATVGSIGVLFGFMSLLQGSRSQAQRTAPWVVAVIAFAVSIIMALVS